MSRYEKTILVIDDEPDDLTFIERAFRKIGVTGPIHLLTNGEEAIAYMMGERQYADRKKYAYPTFIITDLKMPGGDGFAVLEHLKANPEWAVIPTIVLSASDHPDDVRTAYRLGASSYHVKQNSYTALERQLKILHDYWMTCEIPEVEVSGRQIRTDSEGKLGRRFPEPPPADQARV